MFLRPYTLKRNIVKSGQQQQQQQQQQGQEEQPKEGDIEAGIVGSGAESAEITRTGDVDAKDDGGDGKGQRGVPPAASNESNTSRKSIEKSRLPEEDDGATANGRDSLGVKDKESKEDGETIV